MVFILRLRTNVGMQRLVFPDKETATWKDVQLEIADTCSVIPTEQHISIAPPPHNAPIQTTPTTTLAKLGFNNGDMLYLLNSIQHLTSTSASSSSASSQSTAHSVIPATKPNIPQHKLTPQCQHGPRGACPYCMSAPIGSKVQEGKCNHSSSATCIHCSKYIKNAGENDPAAPWLCNHPSTVFCVKCAPPVDENEGPVPQCTCDTARGQQCVKCLTKPTAIKVDKIPFAKFLDDRRAICKFKHGPTVTCAYCAAPDFPNFAAKKSCDKGHLPYPLGVCLNCAPPNAILRPQPYRHVDSVSIQAKILQSFYTTWARQNTKTQRAALLFGSYVDEPAETNNPGAIRANVYALYEPPQEYSNNAIRFLKDDREKIVHKIAQHLKLEPVGWVVATEERKGEKYGGAVFLSASEFEQAAEFQWKYRNAETNYSRFSTIILEHSTTVEPRAYQVADMAVALNKENLFTPSKDPYMLSTRLPKPNELLPKIVYKDRPLPPGEEFLPDEMIVKVILTSPKTSDSVLIHSEFPYTGGEILMKEWNKQHSNEDYDQRLADFGLLVALVKILGEPLVLEICDSLAARTSLSSKTRSAIDSAFIERDLL